MNTLRNVEGLAAECARVVKPNGVVIVAGPRYHLVGKSGSRYAEPVSLSPTPSASHSKLHRFFESIECRGHCATGKYSNYESEL
jgi:hypothetical protein